MKSIRHRRGALSEWESINPVIPDGEIALIKRDTGYDIAIGDGETPFNELRTLSGRIITDNSGDWLIEDTLRAGDDHRFDLVEELYLDIALPIPDDFFATITFISDDPATTLSLPEDLDVYFTGTDCEEGVFSPVEYMRYNVFFFYDGSMQGVVRGYEI